MGQFKGREIEQYQTSIDERDKEINRLRAMISERNLVGAESDQALARDDEKNVALKEQVRKLNKLNAKLTKLLQEVIDSRSWKITKILRKYNELLTNYENDSDDYLENFLKKTKKELKQSEDLLAVLNKRGYVIPVLRTKPLEEKPAWLMCFYHLHSYENSVFIQSVDEGNSNKTINLPALSEQFELAKLYGIEAFCIILTCHDSRIKGEDILKDFFKNNDSLIKYCFCLDFKTEDIQNENETKLFDYIQRVSQYLKESPYVKIENKPLLVIRNLELFPNCKDLITQLRQSCRESNIGELYLVWLQTDEVINVQSNCFDGVIDFQPANLSPNEKSNRKAIGEKITRNNQFDNTTCHFYNTVTALKENIQPLVSEAENEDSDILMDDSPCRYQINLFGALTHKADLSTELNQRLIFISSWNASKEIQLEPDQRYGYAFLEATRMALVRKSLIDKREDNMKDSPIAVVIHAYYEDVFDEILVYLEKIPEKQIRLYITTPIEKFKCFEKKLNKQKYKFYLLPVSNRGRDILPFLKVMPEVLKNGHELLIKIHTKKSKHREDGDVWRNDIFQKLITEKALIDNLEQLANHHEIGMLGPSEHIVPMSFYMGANEKRVAQLAARLGVAKDNLQSLNFVAGTMFMARTKAIVPLMNLALTEIDFEAEVNQTDGTLAHAFERVFAISAFSVGLAVNSPDNVITENYRFVNQKDNTKIQE